MAGALANGVLHVISTMQGHDGFLLEPKQIGAIRSLRRRRGQRQEPE